MSAEPKQPFIVPRCTADIKVVYADTWLLIINKPSGLLTVPGRHPLNKDSLYNRILVHHPEARVIHRLDMDTSGLVMIALGAAANAALSQLFQERTIYKEYVAVVNGLVHQNEGIIDLPISADWPNRPLQKICHAQGKPSVTRYEVLARNAIDTTSRLKLVPHTGRSHQLRIHLRELGHPILGCDMYAPPAVLAMATRLLLHAKTLAFVHPYTEEPVSFTVPETF